MRMLFCIRFISPLLCGSASPEERLEDNIGKSLRGCWRFWFRAVAGGLLPAVTAEELGTLEGKIFGDTGQTTFRLIAEPPEEQPSKSQGQFNRLPHRAVGDRAPRKGWKAGTEFKVSIIPRKGFPVDERNILIASIWTWANLGAVGNRARRGFGSPIIICSSDRDDPFGSYAAEHEKDYPLYLPNLELIKSKDELEQHLSEGLEAVWQVFGKWLTDIGKAPIPVCDRRPGPSDFFILNSLDQISVSDENYRALDGSKGAIDTVHGRRECKGLGGIDPRRASPVFIRLHEERDGSGSAYRPVMTWCRQKSINIDPQLGLNRDNEVRDYLDTIGFKNTLSGNSL